MSIKYSDVIPPFDGSADFGEWIAKVELVASLQEVKNLEKFFPLFLTGGCFAVYQGLEQGWQKKHFYLKSPKNPWVF